MFLLLPWWQVHILKWAEVLKNFLLSFSLLENSGTSVAVKFAAVTMQLDILTSV